mmetsp:Transcript_113150/g.207849  ORF Transcript_113150/g.207849 Transcript_113150/m.207849 type:complete len:376 (+) Transcript_113150:76-1203(+)
MTGMRAHKFVTSIFLLAGMCFVQASLQPGSCEAVLSSVDEGLSLLQIGSKPTQAQDPFAGEARNNLPQHLYEMGLKLLRREEILNAVVAKTTEQTQTLAGQEVTFRIAEGAGFDGVDGYGLELLESEGGSMVNMLDIGGHIGRVTISAFKQDPNKMRVVVVEPVPITYFLLRWNLWLNHVPELTMEEFKQSPSKPGVLAFNNGIASLNGKTFGLCYTHPNTMRARVCDCSVQEEVSSVGEAWKQQCFPMVGRTMDWYLNLFDNQKIALVKMDCEGCEHDAVPQFAKALELSGQQIVRFAGELHEQSNDVEDFACKFDAGEWFHHVCFGKWSKDVSKPEFQKGWFTTVPLSQRCQEGAHRGSCVRGAEVSAGETAS